MTDSLLIRPPSTQNSQAQNQSRLAKSSQNADKFAALMAAQNQGLAQGNSNSGIGRNFVLAGRSPSDLLRMQTLNKAQSDIEQTRAMSNLSFDARGSTLDLARSMGQARHLRAITQGGDMFSANIGGQKLGDFVRSSPNHRTKTRKKTKVNFEASSGGIGSLSAQFESGKDGVACVAYDGTGGTSYGKFQIASKVGTMKDFLNFLDDAAPDLAKRLRASGPANTGSRHGAMPDMWKQIASEDPERFEQLQETFATETHYKPALAAIVQKTGLEEDTLSSAMREVIWSTAIQHGPTGASKIFARADSLSGSPSDPGYERKMINNVYQIRGTQFGSSTESIRAAVLNRFKKEKLIALDMLGKESQSNLA